MRALPVPTRPWLECLACCRAPELPQRCVHMVRCGRRAGYRVTALSTESVPWASCSHPSCPASPLRTCLSSGSGQHGLSLALLRWPFAWARDPCPCACCHLACHLHVVPGICDVTQVQLCQIACRARPCTNTTAFAMTSKPRRHGMRRVRSACACACAWD
jgi:hypothetical protein